MVQRQSNDKQRQKPVLQLRAMPHVCYRAVDKGRPRWRFVLIATNKTRGGVTIQSAQIIQCLSSRRVQRTLAGDELLFLQGSPNLAKGESIVLDIQEPSDTDVAATCVDVVIRTQHKNGSISTTTYHQRLAEAKTRAMASPLRGDWWIGNGRSRHHCLGVQFGFDFVHQEDRPILLSGRSNRRPLRAFRTFGQPLYSPVSGTVVDLCNTEPDLRALISRSTFQDGVPGGNKKKMLGNYVIVQTKANDFLLMGHIKRGTVAVQVGDVVKVGEQIACVGNSGNTSAPHLHIELLDQMPDFTKLGTLDLTASGVPFGFRLGSRKRIMVPQTNEFLSA